MYDRNKLLATLQKFTPAEDFSTINRDQELATVKDLAQQLKSYAQRLMTFQAQPQQDSDSTVVTVVSSETPATESSTKPKKKYTLEEIERVEKYGEQVTEHMRKSAIAAGFKI